MKTKDNKNKKYYIFEKHFFLKKIRKYFCFLKQYKRDLVSEIEYQITHNESQFEAFYRKMSRWFIMVTILQFIGTSSSILYLSLDEYK